MRRLWLAFRIFFRTLFDASVAAQVGAVLGGKAPAPPAAPPKVEERKPPPPKPPARSEAVTLLAALQREARFVDFVKEPLGEYTDAQIGAVVRDIHRDCGKVLERMFGLAPVVDGSEGAEIEVPRGFDAGRFHLVGNVTGEPPFHGRLVHHGWEAKKCDVPAWSGTEAAGRVVAAAEVELR